MSKNDDTMIENWVKMLGITTNNITKDGIKRSPVISVKKKSFLDKERVKVGSCSGSPVIMSRKDRYDIIKKQWN